MKFTTMTSTEKAPIPNAVLGMSFFLAVEAMLFCGLISSFVVIRAGMENWPPIGQPRLPIALTGFNTLCLMASGVFAVKARKALARDEAAHFLLCIGSALLLGLFFVSVQGLEWMALIHEGLTLQSSRYGAIFYFLIGMHALHAVAGLATLAFIWLRARRGNLRSAQRPVFDAALMYWLFVTGLWPILYVVVYLA